MGSAKMDLDKMPEDVKDVFGHAIDLAQAGQKHADAKPLQGFKSAGVLEGLCRIKQFLSKNGVDFIEQFLLEIA